MNELLERIDHVTIVPDDIPKNLQQELGDLK